MIKENIETINELVIKPMYENGEFPLRLADEIADAIYKRAPLAIRVNDSDFGECKCGYEFNSELIYEYEISFCPDCGQAIDVVIGAQDDQN